MRKKIKQDLIKLRKAISISYIIILILIMIGSIFVAIAYGEKNKIIFGVSINIISICLSVIAFYIYYKASGIKEPLFDENISLKKCEYYERFNEVDWGELIERSLKIEIVVCYFDSWITKHRDNLKKFFENGGEIDIYIGDPSIEHVWKTILDRFPENKSNEERLRRKILGTCEKLYSYGKEHADKHGKDIHSCVRCHFAPQSPNYSVIIFDQCKLYLSIYEQFRDKEKKIQSPVFVINLQESLLMKKFWEKELERFKKVSRLMSPEECNT